MFNQKNSKLRERANQKNAPANFPEDRPYDYEAQIPQSDPTAGQQYRDPAEAAKPKGGAVRSGERKSFK